MQTVHRYDTAALDAYWQHVSDRHSGASDNGLELICYAGMPAWFNHLIHHYQMKTFREIVSGHSFASSSVLDIGTGVGRWARWYAAWPGASVTGIDLEPARLAYARTLGGGIDFQLMNVDKLAFPDGSFDTINSITVLQHVPDDVKLRALAEVSRVATDHARVVMFELIDTRDDAPHVFPWAPMRWERELARYGFRPERRLGTEYIPLLRLLKRIHRGSGLSASRDGIDAIKQGRRTPADRIQLLALHGAVVASYPLEELARRIAAPSPRIGAWLFRRGSERPTEAGGTR